jgi:signal transduction histidine kinase
MKPKLAVILILIVLLPLGVMGWLGFYLARGEQETVLKNVRNLIKQQLHDVENEIEKVLSARKREFSRLVGSNEFIWQAENIRKLVRDTPQLRQVFVIGKDKKRVHPPLDLPRSQAERDFLIRAKQVFEDQALFLMSSQDDEQLVESDARHGWYTWFVDQGLNFIYWQRSSLGQVIGFELDPYRLIADIIAQMPSLNIDRQGGQDYRIRLINSRGDVLYQWGTYTQTESEPVVKLGLKAPLATWELDWYGSIAQLAGAVGTSSWFYFISGLIAVSLALMIMAVYFYRASTEEIRQASQRVSFVNHVSHELKTPLTNIRMYAELLQDVLDDENEKQKDYLKVVVSESQRLSRLIENVLSFARQAKNALKLRYALGTVDQVITRVLSCFQPAFDSKGIDVKVDLAANTKAQLDSDALEQIVSNLLSNVEKYVGPKTQLSIASRQTGERIVITVADSGPGIPAAEAESIFQPFYRMSSKTNDGVAGTGIGLSIARELARLHGGDLELVSGKDGAKFQVTIIVKNGDD